MASAGSLWRGCMSQDYKSPDASSRSGAMRQVHGVMVPNPALPLLMPGTMPTPWAACEPPASLILPA